MGQTKPHNSTWKQLLVENVCAAGLYLLFKLSLLSSVRPLFFPLSRHLLMQTCRQKKVFLNATLKDLKCFGLTSTYLVAAVKEEHKFDIGVVVHDFVPALKVVLVSRETVNEKTELLLVFLHGVFHCLSAHDFLHYLWTQSYSGFFFFEGHTWRVPFWVNWLWFPRGQSSPLWYT